MAEINTNKKIYGINELSEFTFKYDDGESVSISISKDGEKITTPDVTGKNEYTYTPIGAGIYTAYLSVWNSKGHKDNETITFEVTDNLKLQSTLSNTDKYKIRSEIANLNQASKCIAVAYDKNNRVLELDSKNLSAGTTECELSLSKNTDINYIKVFLWDLSLKPLTNENKLDIDSS